MTAINWRGRILSALCTLCLLLAIASCTSGGTTPDDVIPGTGPSIFGLTKSSVNSGESLSILGSNFGTAQGSGTVFLGGTSLSVTSWGPNQIDVTVPAGAESGVIVVTQNGSPSESGQEAQLFVGAAPSVTPVILTISPDAARAGQEEISIVGTGFGSPGGSNAVLFVAAGGGTVPGAIVNNDATGEPQWTATNIRVLVPPDARSGPVYVSTSNGPSNGVQVDVLPPQINLDNTKINTVTPAGGPVGTEIQIAGEDFGNFQGNSRAFIQSFGNDRELIILEWTNTLIRATLPLGATTGTLHVIVSGKDIPWGTPLIVALAPQITGVTPSSLRIGKPVTIIGKHFGDEPGSLTFGSTNITEAQITSWSDTQVTLDKLPSITPPVANDPHLNVVLTSTAGLPSAPFIVQLVSDLRGAVTVNPKTGIATKTQFTFAVSAAGNDDSIFKYTLTPDVNNPGVTVVSSPVGSTSADPQLKYIYPVGGTFKTTVKIEDTVTGDFLILSDTTTPPTPTITVGGPSDVVIVDFGPLDFARPPAQKGENDYMYRLISAGPPPVYDYSDLLFTPATAVPQDIWCSRGDDDINVNGNSAQFSRNQADFLFGTPKQRPYGYRRNQGGGKVRLHGYNFGPTPGTIKLNASGANPVVVSGINPNEWNVKTDGSGLPAGSGEDGWIDFTLPLDLTSIGGKIEVTNSSAISGLTADPLIVSAFMPTGNPGNSSLADSAVQAIVTVHDGTAPQIPGISGAQTRMFLVVQASYNDPFNGDAPVQKQVLCLNPFPVTIINNVSFSIDLEQLGGTANIEAYDAGGTQYQPVGAVAGNVQLLPGTYKVFLWTGVLPNDGTISGNLLATCGVMSDLKDFTAVP